MIQRRLVTEIEDALADTPVVLLHGARRVGKSTLVQSLLAAGQVSRYVTLDDLGVLSAATSDPVGFVDGLECPAAIDEVQRAPGLFLAIKARVDRERRPGAFILTGSANALLLPSVADSLAGRIQIATLWPLSQSEIESVPGQFIDTAFADTPSWPADCGEPKDETLTRVVMGGYPEAIARDRPRRRAAWFQSYLTSILQRDVRELAQIERTAELPRMLGLIAARAGGPLNLSELARAVGLPRTTVDRYVSLLRVVFLMHVVPAWSSNLTKRLVRSPKVYLNDTGLLAHLLGARGNSVPSDSPHVGRLVENFAAVEIQKQVAVSETQPSVFHLRTHTQREVDVILEDSSGRVVGIEVKAGATPSARDFRHLRGLAEDLGDRFVRGIVLYMGREVVAFGPNMLAVPIPALCKAG